MPHPVDRALAGAVGKVIGQLRRKSLTTREIATHFDVADSTITRWEKGKRTPALDQLPDLDALAGKPRGHVLRIAGYVDDPEGFVIDVETAVMRDPDLDSGGVAAVMQVYGVVRKTDSVD